MSKNEHFGFGTMRLPLLDSADPTSFDYDTIEKLFDLYLARGFTYFDTAYVYHGGQAEQALRKALVERHPRDRFELATKLPMRNFTDAADMKRIFAQQLANCGVTYFDYYLLHNMGRNVWQKAIRYDAFGFLKSLKDEGKALHVGFSFHDSPELLDEILSEYSACVDFVQLQVNYLDMDQVNVQARRCLAVAAKYQKPVTVMEPCKGGTLVKVPQEAAELMKACSPERSIASWAFRYAANQPGVTRVLSGMNSLEQLNDNCATFEQPEPLSEKELAVIEKVIAIINSNTAVPCTGCGYCAPGCPMKIAIPQYFAAYNSIMRTTGSSSSQGVYYRNTALDGHGKASDCLKCGQCEQACPQHLPIRRYLEQVAEKFESGGPAPVKAK